MEALPKIQQPRPQPQPSFEPILDEKPEIHLSRLANWVFKSEIQELEQLKKALQTKDPYLENVIAQKQADLKTKVSTLNTNNTKKLLSIKFSNIYKSLKQSRIVSNSIFRGFIHPSLEIYNSRKLPEIVEMLTKIKTNPKQEKNKFWNKLEDMDGLINKIENNDQKLNLNKAELALVKLTLKNENKRTAEENKKIILLTHIINPSEIESTNTTKLSKLEETIKSLTNDISSIEAKENNLTNDYSDTKKRFLEKLIIDLETIKKDITTILEQERESKQAKLDLVDTILKKESKKTPEENDKIKNLEETINKTETDTSEIKSKLDKLITNLTIKVDKENSQGYSKDRLGSVFLNDQIKLVKDIINVDYTSTTDTNKKSFTQEDRKLLARENKKLLTESKNLQKQKQVLDNNYNQFSQIFSVAKGLYDIEKLEAAGQAKRNTFFTSNYDEIDSLTIYPDSSKDLKKTEKDNKPTILFSLGNASTYEASIEMAKDLANKQQANVVLYNGPEVMLSRGKEAGTEDAIEAYKAVFLGVKELVGGNPKKILPMGHSLGSAIMIQALDQLAKEGHGRVSKCLSICGFSSFAGFIGGQYPWIPTLFVNLGMKFMGIKDLDAAGTLSKHKIVEQEALVASAHDDKVMRKEGRLDKQLALDKESSTVKMSTKNRQEIIFMRTNAPDEKKRGLKKGSKERAQAKKNHHNDLSFLINTDIKAIDQWSQGIDQLLEKLKDNKNNLEPIPAILDFCEFSANSLDINEDQIKSVLGPLTTKQLVDLLNQADKKNLSTHPILKSAENVLFEQFKKNIDRKSTQEKINPILELCALSPQTLERISSEKLENFQSYLDENLQQFNIEELTKLTNRATKNNIAENHPFIQFATYINKLKKSTQTEIEELTSALKNKAIEISNPKTQAFINKLNDPNYALIFEDDEIQKLLPNIFSEIIQLDAKPDNQQPRLESNEDEEDLINLDIADENDITIDEGVDFKEDQWGNDQELGVYKSTPFILNYSFSQLEKITNLTIFNEYIKLIVNLDKNDMDNFIKSSFFKNYTQEKKQKLLGKIHTQAYNATLLSNEPTNNNTINFFRLFSNIQYPSHQIERWKKLLLSMPTGKLESLIREATKNDVSKDHPLIKLTDQILQLRQQNQ